MGTTNVSSRLLRHLLPLFSVRPRGRRNRRGGLGDGRGHALGEEVDYWEQWLADRGGKYADEFAQRFDPAAEVTDLTLRAVLSELRRQGRAEPSILDVGAGPASTVGHRLEGGPVSLVAVDPLANDYRRVLDEHGLKPPVPTERLEGEQLVERFGSGRFDVAYARNAIDHSVHPIVIIENMLAVVRPGGYVVLRHVRNEAVRQDWAQLHQWNFDVRESELVIWGADTEIRLAEHLPGATASCHVEPSDEPGVTWVVAVIRKARSDSWNSGLAN